LKAKDIDKQTKDQHIRENSLTIFGFNSGDNPEHIKEFFRKQLNKLIEEDDEKKLNYKFTEDERQTF